MYSITDRRRLVNALLDIEELRTQSWRTTVVNEIEAELGTRAISAARRAENIAERDAECIVAACIAIPDGLATLCEVVEVKLGGSLPAVRALLALCSGLRPLAMLPAERCDGLDELLDAVPAPDDLGSLLRFAVDRYGLPTGPARTDLRAAIRDLRERVSPRPLFRFVEALAAETDDPGSAEDLRAWSDATAPLTGLSAQWLTELRVAVAARRPPERGYVLIRLTPDMLDQELFHLSAWMVRSGRYDRLTGESDHPRPLTTLAEATGGRVVHGLPAGGAPPIVEFLLPHDRLNEDVERWPAPAPDGADSEFGLAYPVVVRPLDHREHAGPIGAARRRDRAARLRRSETYDPTAILWHDGEHPVGDDDWLCVAMLCPTVADSGAPCLAMLARDAPAALWHRGSRSTAQRRKALRQVLTSRALATLPDTVRQQRRGARHPLAGPDHAGRDLVLYWADDPDRTPPEWYPLSAPEGAPTP
ncbi:hypothetical protein ACFP2T_11480 [Plantactinospora solaniradicis]|uniref:DUF222 domain-containing protein n=1 Tax=Plantactinospora solaniradicis TaxID=1723736 RepID=A0ABW1K5D1_9ACTN